MTRKEAHIVRELVEYSEDPDYHPMIRELFANAAKIITELRADLDAMIQEGSDHD